MSSKIACLAGAGLMALLTLGSGTASAFMPDRLVAFRTSDVSAASWRPHTPFHHYCSPGLHLDRVCVAWGPGAPGTFAGPCVRWQQKCVGEFVAPR